MKIKTITYQRVKNLGNYESERLEASADLPEGEDFFAAFILLKHDVEVALGIMPDSSTPDDEDF